MSDTLNVNVLVAAKDEYTGQLCSSIKHQMLEIVYSLYKESQLNNKRLKISYSNFQLTLKDVPNWSEFKIEEKLSKVNSKCPYLMDLITAIFVSHVKILACVRLKKDDKSVKIKVPNLNVFLHKILINICENIYYKPTVIDQNKEVILDIIVSAITETITNQIPIQSILNEYLSGVFNEDDDQTEEYPKEDLPMIPIERPIDRPSELDNEHASSEELSRELKYINDLDNKDSIKINKKNTIEDNSESEEEKEEKEEDEEKEENEEDEEDEESDEEEYKDEKKEVSTDKKLKDSTLF